MKRRLSLIALSSIVLSLSAQTNMILNSSFEGDISTGDYPRNDEPFSLRTPSDWFDFRSSKWGYWIVDEQWVTSNPNAIDPDYQNAYYFQGLCQNQVSPFQSTFYQGPTLTPQMALDGEYFIGFDAGGTGPEGIQQRFTLGCPLNAGEYEFRFWGARPFEGGTSPQSLTVRAYLSELHDQTGYRIDSWQIDDYPSPGAWQGYTKSFELKIDEQSHQDLKWLAITGHYSVSNTECGQYVFIDDVALYRPCDDLNACWPGTGQICPTLAIQAPPTAPFKLYGIDNATELEIRITNMLGQTVIDTTHTNYNGLPDFYWPGEILAGGGVASGQYTYEITLRNLCGGYKKDGVFTVLSGQYDSIPAWTDSTADWTTAPVPCCLLTLTLENKIIHGDVCFLVQDTILIRDNVSVTPGSTVLIQAPVIELRDSVEFDGNVSDVTIVEGPCVGCRIAADPGLEPQRAGLLTDAGPGSIIPYVESPEPASTLQQPSADAAQNRNFAPHFVPAKQPRISVFPNPNDGQATLTLDLQSPARVQAHLHDALLAPARALVEPTALLEGRHTLQLDMGNLPAGMYLLRVQIGDQMLTEKVVLR